MSFRFDELEITVLGTRDQYNDYSVKYDVLIEVHDPVSGQAWIQAIVAKGEDISDVSAAFKLWLQNGWIRPPLD